MTGDPVESVQRPTVFVRRVHPQDAQTMRIFLMGLSAKSRRERFHAAVSGDSPKLVGDLVSADGERHAGWAACVWGPHGEEISARPVGTWSTPNRAAPSSR